MSRADDVRIPLNAGSNEYGVKKIDSDTTHKQCELPESWAGKFVDIYCSGGDVHFGCDITEQGVASSAEISTAVAATDAGASATVGAVAADGLANRVPKLLPHIKPGQRLWLVHEATVANTILYVELSSH